MIEIKIPKEINKYEAKFIGPFTMRQSVCLGIGLPVSIGLYALLKPHLGVDLAGFIIIIPAVLCYLFGWHKPYGMRFEKYLQSVFVGAVLAPTKRVYKTENYYTSVLKEIEKVDAENLAQEQSGKKKKKKKYKRSSLAIK